MAKIQNRLDGLQPYVEGIRYLQGMVFVDAVLKDDWTVLTSDYIKKIVSDDDKNHLIFYSEKEGVTIDDLLDFVEKNIKVNIERELKHKYLVSKVEELKKVFKSNSLEKLKTLKFIFTDELISDKMEDDDIDLETEHPLNFTQEDIDENNKLQKEELSKTIIEPQPIIETKPITIQKVSNTNNFNKVKVELPPKGKIQLEVHELPKEMTEGTCNCGPDEYCPKCMDEKGL